MQVSVENVGKLERKLTVKIPAEQFNTQVKSRLQEMGRTVRLKGFRPGKVPVTVIEQRFGAQVRGEALSEMIRNSFQQAVEQQKLRPALAPSIATTGTPSNGEIEYTATFEVFPEFGTIAVDQLAIVKPVATVGDVDVDQMIETLRMQRRTWASVERAVQTGDMVLFEFSAQTADFRFPEKGEERVGTIVGSGAMVKELEDQLIGHKAGDELEIDIVFPAEFRIGGLAGKLSRVNAKLIRIQEPKMPELDEEFISTFGGENSSLEQFRADVLTNLQRELKGALTGRLKAEVIEKLLAAHVNIDVPQGMIDAEANAMAKQAEAHSRQQGQVNSQPAETFKEIAKRRVTAALLLGEIARQADIRVDSKRVTETLATIASTYEEPHRVVELYSKDAQLMSGLQNRVLEDQVVEWIADHAQVTENSMSFSDVMRRDVS